jgi:peptidylprolyl isomerase
MLGMARGPDLDSANSQFFIMLGPAIHLNSKYTAFGRVLKGLEHVEALKKGSPHINNGMVDDPDILVRARIAADGN